MSVLCPNILLCPNIYLYIMQLSGQHRISLVRDLLKMFHYSNKLPISGTHSVGIYKHESVVGEFTSKVQQDLSTCYSKVWKWSSRAFWSLHLLGLIISEIFCHFASVMAIYLSVVYDETMTEGSIKPAKMTQNILVFVMPLVEIVTLLVI